MSSTRSSAATGGRDLDAQAVQFGQVDLGQDLDGDIGQEAFRAAVIHLFHVGLAGDGQLVLLDAGEGQLAHRLLDDLVAQGLLVHFFHHVHRHFALAEAGHFHFMAVFLGQQVDGAGDLLAAQRNLEAAQQRMVLRRGGGRDAAGLGSGLVFHIRFFVIHDGDSWFGLGKGLGKL